MTDTIRQLFARQIDRRIEEVIKVDSVEEKIIRDEIEEYVVTDALRRHYVDVLDRYLETPNKPHEGTCVWVSGFFGSGKSSFAKILGLALENRAIGGTTAAELFAQRTGDAKIDVLLKGINERIPTHAVIFDVSTDRGIRSGEQRLTEIAYRLFLKNLGYAHDLDLAELEITLEEESRLDEFKQAYRRLYDRDWDTEKAKVAIALGHASRVMHELEPATYNEADSWVKAAKGRADVSPNLLAERCRELMDRRKPGHALVFVVDEVGQFVARDVQKMLDLQGIAQALGRIGRGRLWMVVTSQEKLNDLVGGLDDRRVELARLQDRFPLRVDLEQSDISEVTSRRVLAKNADAQTALRTLFDQHRGRLTQNTRLTADITLPDLDAGGFVDLYPLLPYQIDLIIKVVSGLRTQGGSSRHVGGANRTIIKLAQQLLINPLVALAEQPVGQLARIDQIYDLVKDNVDSEVVDKIKAIGIEVDHPMAQPVAKAICLLQFVQSIHRTAENIAATLHPAVDADSQLATVKQALDELVRTHAVRLGDDGYRIPTPAEDDWERQRATLAPRPSDVNRLQAGAIEGLWKPQPSLSFHGIKLFKAGLHLNNKPLVDGDVTVQMLTATAGQEFDDASAEARKRSQTERGALFWVVPLDAAVDRATVELFRSEDMLERRGRTAQSRAETALVGEEKRRRQAHADELRRLLKASAAGGTVFFRGNDRSPGEQAGDIAQIAKKLLDEVLPHVYDRFADAAAKVQSQDLNALLTADNLRGLTPIFTRLNLIHEENGQPVFRCEDGPLAEVLSRIENQHSYGESPSGRSLADHFGREPYGWEFDMVRLLTLSLLRAGKVDVTSKGHVIESAQSLPAKEVYTNNNVFRQASFRPRKGIDIEEIIKAAAAFQEVVGKELPELEQGAAAAAIRAELERHENDVDRVHDRLVELHLPGADALAEAVNAMRAIRTGSEENAILTFNGSHARIAEAIKRCAEIDQNLTEPAAQRLRAARTAITEYWPFLRTEEDLPAPLEEDAEVLDDLLRRETFFRDLPEIDQRASRLEAQYRARYDDAVRQRITAYQKALERLRSTPGYERLDQQQEETISEPLRRYAAGPPSTPVPIAQLRAETDACAKRLDEARERVLRATADRQLAHVNVSSYFDGGIETPEQLDRAIDGLRDECLEQIGAGKRVVVR